MLVDRAAFEERWSALSAEIRLARSGDREHGIGRSGVRDFSRAQLCVEGGSASAKSLAVLKLYPAAVTRLDFGPDLGVLPMPPMHTVVSRRSRLLALTGTGYGFAGGTADGHPCTSNPRNYEDHRAYEPENQAHHPSSVLRHDSLC